MLRDPRLELFSRELAARLAQGVPASRAAAQSAEAAGYPNPKGKSFGPNARKRSQRRDVRKRVAELQAPAIDRGEIATLASIEWAATKLFNLADLDLGDDAVKIPDQIAAIKLLAQIRGWMAPEKIDHTLRATNVMTDDELASIAARSSEGTPGAPFGS